MGAMRVTASSLTLVIFIASIARAGLSTAAPTIPVALAPISAAALHGCRAADLEKALKGGFGRAKRFRLALEAEEAPTRMEILECSWLDQRKQTLTSKSGPVKGPVGDGVGIGVDSELGIQVESVGTVILRVRLVAGPRSVDVASGGKDRNLREAAGTLRRAIDRVLTERGEWLLAAHTSPP